MSDADNGLPFEPWDWEEDDETPLNDLHTPEGASDFIREAVRQDLAPRTDDLVGAPLRDDVDGGHALAGFLLRAAETGENAESCLDRLGDLDGLTDNERAVLARARDLLFAASGWVYFDDNRARIPDIVDELERAVGAISAAADVDEQPQLGDLPEIDAHPDDTRWKKHTVDTWAEIRSPLVNSNIDPDFGDDVTTQIELLEMRGSGDVSIGTSVDATTDSGGEVELHVNADLTPSQAESLADALYEQAVAAREQREERDQQ